MFPIAEGGAWPTKLPLDPGERALWSNSTARLVEYRLMPAAKHKPPLRVAVPVDTGTVTVTNQRAIFDGFHKHQEWLWANVVGITNDDDDDVWVEIATTDQDQMAGVAVDELPALHRQLLDANGDACPPRQER